MAKGSIFKSRVQQAQKMRTLEKSLKSRAERISKMSAPQLRAYIRDSDKLLEFKFQQQSASLKGFETQKARDFRKDRYGLRTGVDKASRATLQDKAMKYAEKISSRETTMSFAEAERHRKLDALRRVGISNPRTADVDLFWTIWDDMADEGLPPYLEKLGGLDINGLYSARDAYNEWKSLPASERTDANIRQLVKQNFVNTQAVLYGPGYEDDKQSALENWKRMHKGKEPTKDLTINEIRMYSSMRTR